MITSIRLCPKGAALLFACKHSLQRVTWEARSVMFLLRAVDHGEPRMQLLQVIGRILGGGLHRLTKSRRHRIEALVHGLL